MSRSLEELRVSRDTARNRLNQSKEDTLIIKSTINQVERERERERGEGREREREGKEERERGRKREREDMVEKTIVTLCDSFLIHSLDNRSLQYNREEHQFIA